MLTFVEGLNRALIRLLQLVYLNFLWLGVTILGLGIFTVGPATYSLAAVSRRWLRSKDNFPVARTFFYYFKEGFREALLISWLYLLGAAILLVDLMYISNWYLRAVFYLIGFMYLLSLVFVFPIMVHYDWRGRFFKIKMAFLFGFSHLQYSLVLLTVLAVIYGLMIRFVPGALTFIGMSFLVFAVTWLSQQIFRRLESENAAGVVYKSINQRIKEKINEKKRIIKTGKS